MYKWKEKKYMISINLKKENKKNRGGMCVEVLWCETY